MPYELDLRFPDSEDQQALEDLLARLGTAQGIHLVLRDSGHTDEPPTRAPSTQRPSDRGPSALVLADSAPQGRIGLDLLIPQGQEEEAVQRAVAAILDAGAAVGASLFDPQLGRVLTQGDQGLVVTEYLRWSRYEVESLGPHETLASAVGYDPGPSRRGWGLSTWVWAMAAALLLLGLAAGPLCGL